MANYANKYRPTKFSQVIGQDSTVKIIRGMLTTGEIHPTILLCGPHSTGKTTLARLIALYANCEALVGGEPCGECNACVGISKALKGELEHPALIEQNVADKRKIEDIRNLISIAGYRTQHRYRFIILDEAHNFTKQAFEASLKLFEESGKKQTRFILCTTAPGALSDTNRSRCKIMHLNRIPIETTAKLLFDVAQQEEKPIPKNIAIDISQAAGGYPRDALNILESVLQDAGKEFDPKSLPAIIRKVEDASPLIIAQKYVEAVLAGKFGSALFAAQRVSVHEYFIDRVVAILQYIVYLWVNKRKLADPEERYLIRSISQDVLVERTENQLQRVQDLGRLLSHCLTAQEQIKRYLVEPAAAVDALTLQIVSITRNWRKD